MAGINRDWHSTHRMPRNATEDERIAWHLEHARMCGCRPIGGRLAEVMTARGIEIPVFQPSPPPDRRNG